MDPSAGGTCCMFSIWTYGDGCGSDRNALIISSAKLPGVVS